LLHDVAGVDVERGVAANQNGAMGQQREMRRAGARIARRDAGRLAVREFEAPRGGLHERLGRALPSATGDASAVQYGGELFDAASAFARLLCGDLRRHALAGGPHTAGALALVALLLRLPCLHVWLTEAPAGRRIRAHMCHRSWGVPHARIAQGVLALRAADEAETLRGRPRHALRTNNNRARAAGVRCQQLASAEERRRAAVHLGERIPHMRGWTLDRFAQPGDRWWGAHSPSGTPIGLAQVTVDREWALLHSFAASDHAARSLLHTTLAVALGNAGVRYLVTDAPIALRLTPKLQYWQRLVGYQVTHLAVHRAPLVPLAAPLPALPARLAEPAQGAVGATVSSKLAPAGLPTR
jgi:hypothetical protein